MTDENVRCVRQSDQTGTKKKTEIETRKQTETEIETAPLLALSPLSVWKLCLCLPSLSLSVPAFSIVVGPEKRWKSNVGGGYRSNLRR
jgi:hypothetical protein